MKDSKAMSYEAPEVKVIEIEVEQGFAASSTSTDSDVMGWGDGGYYEDSFTK